MIAVVGLGACANGNSPPDPRKQAINACVQSDPTLTRAACSCLVDELGLTADEVEELGKLEERDVADPNAEIERILGRRRAEVLLAVTADCNSQ